MSNKSYAVIDHGWGDQVLVPLCLVDKLVSDGYVVRTDADKITAIDPIRKFQTFSEEEVKAALVQCALEKES
jgi:hypothetical protein